jgi:hypothetical protein
MVMLCRAGAIRYHGGMATPRKPPPVRLSLAEFLTWKPDDAAVWSSRLIAEGSPPHDAISLTGVDFGTPSDLDVP